VAGLAGGVAFVLRTFLTFALLGGSRQGETGVLIDPDTQHPKVIAAWKEIEPLPRVIDQPAIVLAGMVVFGIAYAFLYPRCRPAGRQASRVGRRASPSSCGSGRCSPSSWAPSTWSTSPST
jgi:hypothetical protein